MLHRRSTASNPGPQAPPPDTPGRPYPRPDSASTEGRGPFEDPGVDDETIAGPGNDPRVASLDFDDPSPIGRDSEFDELFGMRSGEGDVSGPFDGAWSPRDAADLVDGLDGDLFDLDPYD